MMGDVDTLTGQLLIAGSAMFDPHFRRAVVLVGQHDEDGAVGVVLNRPLDIPVRDAVPELGALVGPDDVVLEGGPVREEGVVVVAEFSDPSRAEILAFGAVGFLPPESEDDIATAIVRARVFAGYAGWGPSQLEAEMEEDSWIVEPAMPGDVFHPDPRHLWEDVLRRKGPQYDMLRLMPVDPSMN